MNTKTIQHIKDLINQGHWVEGKRNNGEYHTFVFIDYNENFHALSGELFTINYVSDFFTNEYKVVTPPPTGLKVGDLVEILDTPELREILKRNSNDATYMVGQKGLEIRELTTLIGVFNINKSDYWYFPYWAVAKCLPEEKIELTDDELKQELERRGLLVDGKVLK